MVTTLMILLTSVSKSASSECNFVLREVLATFISVSLSIFLVTFIPSKTFKKIMKQDQHLPYYSYHTTKLSQITTRYVILTFESVDKIMIFKQISPEIHISHK